MPLDYSFVDRTNLLVLVLFFDQILENFIADVYKTRTGKYMSESMLALVWSVAVSVFAVGGMVGGISGGAIADYCGR